MKRLLAIPTVGLMIGGLALAAEAREPGGVGGDAVASTTKQAHGAAPQQAFRRAALDLKTFKAERVEATPIGAGQFLLLDQTSLTVWPDSDIVLDAYLYDPETATGEMTLSATRGVMRFIGGKISKTTDVIVTTPHTVIAIPGGLAQIEATSDRPTAPNIPSEHIRMSNRAGSVTPTPPIATAAPPAGAPRCGRRSKWSPASRDSSRRSATAATVLTPNAISLEWRACAAAKGTLRLSESSCLRDNF